MIGYFQSLYFGIYTFLTTDCCLDGIMLSVICFWLFASTFLSVNQVSYWYRKYYHILPIFKRNHLIYPQYRLPSRGQRYVLTILFRSSGFLAPLSSFRILWLWAYLMTVTLPEPISSPPAFSCFIITCPFVRFSFGHCIVCPLIYGFLITPLISSNISKSRNASSPLN